ncbi:SAV_2336 N-terminal domain-related protein [Actinomadura sp. 9N215]|uniref:SAV_2336 N-terminal domain-related protein n=1 Tax=Actinomadura sp. 9N215 TaxID=3375150 RepID=UPI0037924BFA
MTIDRLREALTAIGPPPDARELSEMLWLACHISPPAEQRPSSPVPPTPRQEPAEPPPPPPSPAPAPPPPAREPLTRLHPRPAPGAEPVGEAAEVLVPTAPMLADPLGVQRALRPLKRRVPSRHRFELDEDATAARIADTRLWTPVLVPSPERWLSLSLVVDTGPTMRLWRPLARELAETLLRQGAFQDVHTAFLDTTGGITATPDAPRQDPGTLLDASGRHAVLVLSDCSGPHWWNGRAAQAVRRWAQTGPTAILQPLAERLWRRTAAPAAPGLAFLPRPAAPNTGLRFTPYDGVASPGVPVPVLELAPRWFGAWARLVSGSGPQPAAVATFASRPSGTAPLHRERELPIGERVRRFLATASPDAAELAAHVAVSVPSLPVMRLIQHRILGGSGPGQLAEVLLSGLLRPTGGVRYEFVPGARDALLDTLPRPEALHTRRVLEAVSAEIERRAGTSADRFRALLPAGGGPLTLTADTDHFALLTPRTRTHLTPTPIPPPSDPDLLNTPESELLGQEWERGPRPTLLGVVDDGAPVWLVPFGDVDRPHGEIVGTWAARRGLVRTLVFSLALSHSPDVVTFWFSGFAKGAAAVGLGGLPHIVGDVPRSTSKSPAVARLRADLETERRRRAAILRNAGTSTWFDYQSDIAGGRRLEPLPALIVILDEPRLSLAAWNDLSAPLARLCETGPALGMEFVFCSSEDRRWPARLTESVWWRITASGRQDDAIASLHIIGESIQDYLPARISRRAGDRILEEILQRLQSTNRGTSPDETAPAPVDRTDGSAEPRAPTPSVPELDVLRLNSGGLVGTFEERWALPASDPRDPAIGHDADGNIVTLYPLDDSSGLPHGLVVGETEARQRVVRAITFALAANYSPSDVRLDFAGLGENPLGEHIDLPHIGYSDTELLGRPDALDGFIARLRDQLDARATAPFPETLPRLLVVADVSLTFPSSRRDVGETLLSLAQRGRALGVQLLLAATTVEDTTIWNRFLPLLGWRIAASRLPPAELRRVLGRASLPFADDRTAYLLAGGGTPRPFTVANEPSQAVVDDFIERSRSRPEQTTSTPHRLTLDQDVEDESIMDLLRELYLEEADTSLSPGGGSRHLVIEGLGRTRMLRAAELYGLMLRSLGILPDGEVREVPVFHPSGRPVRETRSIRDLFDESRGGVLLLHLKHMRPLRTRTGIHAMLGAMDDHGDNPTVVIYGNADEVAAFRRIDPLLADRFRWIVDRGGSRPSRPPASEERILIGVDESGEPVLLDFEADRHLLIIGPPGSGKATLMRRLMEEIARRERGQENRIFFVDREPPPLPSHPGFAEMFGIRYTDLDGAVDSLVLEVIETAHRRARASDRGPYMFIRNRDIGGWPSSLLLIARSGEFNVHLVVSQESGSDERSRRLVEMTRELSAPALLLGHSGGRDADLWRLPEDLRGPIPRGHAILVRGETRTLIRLQGRPDRIGSVSS